MSAVFSAVTGARGSVTRKRLQATFTRPADTTAYAAGDVVGTLTGLIALSGAVPFNGGAGKIIDVVLECNLATVTFGTFRVHFFNASHVPAADNAAFASMHANAAAYQGSVDLPILVADSASAAAAYTRSSGKIVTAEPTLPIPFVCASDADDLYAVVVALAAYVPSSAEVFRLSVVVDQEA